MTSANDIAVKIDTAMAKAEERNPALKGALPLNHFSTLGAELRSIKNLIDSINQISEERYHEEDLIGRIYEYFLQAFAVSASKEDGEFYTPANVVQLIAELIEPYEGVVYDPCCGSGGMFVQSHKFVQSHQGNTKAISVVGQESNPDTWRLCKMNLAIRGISNNLGEKSASSFTEDQHKDKKVDFIMANPPFNLKNWRDENELTSDPRWQGYETPPVTNANYAWILHMLSKLDVNHGIAGFLLANGALNADDTEGKIRQKLLENDKVEAIIVLPRDMFYTTDISVTLWIINMNKGEQTLRGRHLRDRRNEVLFMDLRTWDENIETYKLDKNKKKKKVVITPEQVERVKSIYQSWQDVDGRYEDVPELCKSVTLDELREKDYSLAPSTYIEFVNHDEEINYKEGMATLQNTLGKLISNQNENIELIKNALESINSIGQRDNHANRTYRIGDLIEVVDERNDAGISDFRGVNIDKEFMPTAANTNTLDATKYKIVRNNRFVYSGMQTGRDVCIRISMYSEDEPAIVSPAYTTFEIKDPEIVDPMFFFMLFKSEEMDRLGWFKSDSSIRSNLDWPVFCDFEITLPSIETQRIYSKMWRALVENQRTGQRMKEQMDDMCPILVRDAICE